MKRMFFIIACAVVSSTSYSQTVFQRLIGSASVAEMGSSIQQTTDGGYILSAQGSGRNYLVKLTATGDTSWVEPYLQSGGYVHNMQQTNDGGYILAGFTADAVSSMNDFCLIKTNATGDTLWTSAYKGSPDVMNISVHQTTDNGYIMVSTTDSFGVGTYATQLMRIDATGNLLWSKTYGIAGGSTESTTVWQTADGGFIICGSSIGSVSWDCYLIKTNSSGAVTWSNTYGTATLSESGAHVKQTPDGGYIVAGNQAGTGTDVSNVVLMKLNASGATQWTKLFSGAALDRCNNVSLSNDGGYIMTGATASFGAGANDILLIKTDSTGALVFTKTFGGTGMEEAYSVQQTTDHGFILTGMTASFGAAPGDIIVIKTDSNGNSTTCNAGTGTLTASSLSLTATPTTFTSTAGGPVGQRGYFYLPTPFNVTDPCGTTAAEDQLLSAPQISLFPNPSATTVTLKISGAIDMKAATLTIYNLLGKEVMHTPISSKETSVDLRGIDNGLYFYKVLNGGVVAGSGKLSVQK